MANVKLAAFDVSSRSIEDLRAAGKVCSGSRSRIRDITRSCIWTSCVQLVVHIRTNIMGISRWVVSK